VSLRRYKNIRTTQFHSVPIPVVFAIVVVLILLWASSGFETIQKAIILVIWIVLAILVMFFPILGLGLTIASSAITDVMPNTPFASSFVPIIGIVTLVAFLFQNRRQPIGRMRFSTVEIIGLIWIIWIIVSNPQASVFGSNRNWIFTLIQVWVLAWLARNFVRNKNDHYAIMFILALGILISAASVVLQQGVGTLDYVDRAIGLSDGANTAARYFIYGIALLSVLQSQRTIKPVWRAVGLVGIFILLIALVYTGSRTGIFLLAAMLLILLSQRALIGRRGSIILWLVLLGGIIWYLREVSGTVLEPSKILRSILMGSDTIGYRYDLWRAGWAMWLDHPLAGVGIGQFGNYLAMYWKTSLPIRANTPHNMYIQVLAETGGIGFILFCSMLVGTLYNFWQRAHSEDTENASLNWIWLVILILLLIGGITKTDMIDKLFWFLLGLSANNPIRESVSESSVYSH
jgi:O-antigen ligase